MNAMDKPLLSSRPRAAERLSIGVRTLDAKIATGEIRAVRIGGRVLVSESEIERLAREGTKPVRSNQPETAEVASPA